MVTNKITLPPSSRLGWVIRAILEIIIIVFGILLSLWISNGFQNKQDRQNAQSYLRRLDDNLKEDEAKLALELGQREEQYRQANKMLKAISTSGASEKTNTLIEGFQSLLWTARFSSSDATFRSLENSGELRLIEQDSLVNQIVSLYHNQYEALRENNEDVTKFRDNFLLPFTINNVSFQQAFKPDVGGAPFSEAQLDELYNHLVYETITLNSTVESYQVTLHRVKRLRGAIKNAMN